MGATRPTGAPSTAGEVRREDPGGAGRLASDRRLGYDLRYLLLSQAAPLVASAVVVLVTASILGPSERGRLAYVIATSSLVGAIGCFSLYVGAVNAVRRGQRTAPIQLLTLLVIGLTLINLATLAAWLFADHFALGLLTSRSLMEIVFSASLFALNLFVTRTRQGLGDSRAFQRAATVQAALYLIGAISVAVATRRATPVVLAWDLALVLSTLYCLPGLLQVGRQATRRSVRGALAESTAAHVGIIGQQTLYRADTVLLGVWAPARQVGLYSVAIPIAEIVWVVSEALSLRTFARSTQSDLGSTYNTYRRAVRLNWQACVTGGLIIAGGSWLLLPEVLPAYRSSVHLIWLLGPGMVFQGYARIGLSALVGAGRRRAAVCVGVFSALSVGVYVPLILALDAPGAAIGSSCAYLLQALAVRWYVRRQLALVGSQTPRHRRLS